MKSILFSLFITGIIFFGCSTAEKKNAIDDDLSISEGYILIDSTKLKYVVEGNGLPCLVIGSSVYYPKTFSENIRKHLRFYFVDMRWFAEEYSPVNLDDFTIETIADDIEKVRSELKLENVVLIGHSIHGTIALEYAKRYPQHLSHVVAIGSPSFVGTERYNKVVEDLWATASEERKEYQKRLWEKSKDSIDNASPEPAFILNYIADGARYWYDIEYDAGWLWEGMTIHTELTNHLFGKIFGNYNIADDNKIISTPVFVAMGKYDYIIPYTLWEKAYGNIPDYTLVLFEKSGHTPQLEESEFFDAKLLEWIKRYQEHQIP